MPTLTLTQASPRASALFGAMLLSVWLTSGQSHAAPLEAPSATKDYEQKIRPVFAKYCVDCHGDDTPKRDFRIGGLSADMTPPAIRSSWEKLLKHLKAGTMPPKGEPRPAEEELQSIQEWIAAQFVAADAARRAAEGRVVLRRLNRVEYENTVRDLLGVETYLQDLLPPDASAGGFDNVGEALHTSSFLMERYLEAADKALSLAIANGPQPRVIKQRYRIHDERTVKKPSEDVYLVREDDVVSLTSSPWQSLQLNQFYPPDRGQYRFRISASGHQSAGKPVTYRLDAGLMLMTGRTNLVGYFDAPADTPAVTEFIRPLEARNTIRLLPYGLAAAQHVHKAGAKEWKGPGLAVQWIDVEGPLNDTWPPESHRRIFGDLPQKPAPLYNQSQRVEVVSESPLDDAERILRNFTQRAFRRAVTDEDVQPFLELVKAKLAEQRSFESAVRVALSAVMISPEFLFLREVPGPLDDFALASRLSYFLWSTMPDAELLALADQKKLGEPATLRQQVERMIQDSKATAFTENFVSQWLGLREIDATLPSHILYPEFDDMLKASMLRETNLFFEEVLKNDLSLTNFVSSDFAMLNGRLAMHYGIPGVDGWEFRKIPLPPDSHRGGLLTMASVLKVTANGTSTSPVTRGVWVLERILGQRPPNPPDNVSALEPDIRGATTVREQLAKHREIESCASCHAQIDPPGFALESFDVIGGWRENYRTSGNGKPVTVDGRRMPYLSGKPVEPGDVLPDGRRFSNIDDLKALLLADQDQIARALAIKLITYATGAAPDAADQTQIDALVARVRAQNYGFRTLIHEIVQSELFRTK